MQYVGTSILREYLSRIGGSSRRIVSQKCEAKILRSYYVNEITTVMAKQFLFGQLFFRLHTFGEISLPTNSMFHI